MSRPKGSKNIGNTTYAQLYETLVVETGLDPVRALFKLANSRTQSIKLQACSTLISYRYAKQATAHIELEAAGQMVMTWDNVIDMKPPELIDITPNQELIESG